MKPAIWAGVVCLVLLGAGVGGWKLTDRPVASGPPPVVVGTTEKASTLDPAGGYDAGSWALYSNVFQSLLTLIPGTAEPVPDAARSCRFTDETLLTYSCVLRDGLKFSNGRKMTARDVQYSFERIENVADEQSPAPLFDTLESVWTKGRTVQFNLKAPDAVFPYKIAGAAGAIVDSTRYEPNSLREDGVDGSGPYLLKSYQPGERVELVPNPQYQGANPSPASPITILYYDDAAALAQAWEKNEIDVSDGQMPPDVVASTPPGDSSVAVSDSADIRTMVCNTREGSPLRHTAVRQAIASVIDRERLAAEVHRGTVEPLYSLIPEGTLGHGEPFLDAYPTPDAEYAEQLLSNAGITPPVSFELAYSRGAATREEAELLAGQLGNTGLFRVTAVHRPWKEFAQGIAEGSFDAYLVGWMPDYPDADTYTRTLVGTDSALNTGYSNPEVDALIEDTRGEENRTAAGEDFEKIHEIIAEDVPLIPLWQKKNYVLTAPGVTGSQYLSDYNGFWALWQLEKP